jgi:hypothetical protein
MISLPGSICGLGCGFAILLCGCSSTVSRPVQGPQDIPIEWHRSGAYSPLARPVRILARDRATLAQVPVTEVPVDFERQMVLILALGPTPSSDLGVQITRVWQEGLRLRVQEVQVHPGPDQRLGLNPGSPWTVAVIPRSDLNVQGYSTRVPRGLVSAANESGAPRLGLTP